MKVDVLDQQWVERVHVTHQDLIMLSRQTRNTQMVITPYHLAYLLKHSTSS